MNGTEKGRSPFFPGQPVPIELFTGREAQIRQIERALRQVELGKPQALFLMGEYGIGKSSLAGYIRALAEKKNQIAGMHVMLGGAKKMEEVAIRTVETAIRTRVYSETASEKIRNNLAKYVGSPEIFGFKINLENIRADAPGISSNFLPFLQTLYGRLREEGAKGLLLIFDEINGIANNPDFAHFIKGLVDENALQREPLPLLLMLCGVEDRRKQMIENHQPVERIFDIVQIDPMEEMEMKAFFKRAFGSVGMKITDEGLDIICYNSAGFPKIMHMIGDAVFWTDSDGHIDKDDAFNGLVVAAEDIGRKYVDTQVYKALRSPDYHSILMKLARQPLDMEFKKQDMIKGFSETEKRKFNNFLQKMKKLHVLRSGEEMGEYVFNNRLVRVYLHLDSAKKGRKT